VRDEFIYPYCEDKDYEVNVTVGMLKEMLKDWPDDYELRYDSFVCGFWKGEFTVDHKNKRICLNG
jgi:hypothetical protein